MTATIHDNGFRTRLQRVARGTVVFAIALGVCGLGAGTAAAADGKEQDDATAVEMHLAAGVRGTVAPGSPTSASVTIHNDSESELSAGRVVIEIGRTPLADTAAVSSWLDDDEVAGEFESLGADTTGVVDPDATVTATIPVPSESVAGLTPGVYPLRATLSGATAGEVDSDTTEENVTTTSVLVVTAPSSTPIAVLVPLTATPEDGALLTAEELNTLTGPDGMLTAQLDGVAGTSAVLGVDPAIPAAIRVLGSAAPASAIEWLERLDDLPNERFALQFGDADPATQSQAALPALLQPTTLTSFVDPNNFVASTDQTPTPTPTPTSEPTPASGSTPSGSSPSASPDPSPTDGPVLPDDADLTAVDGAVPGILWPRGELSVADLAAFTGYLGEGVTTVLPSSSVSGAAAGHATIEGRDVLVTDAAASDALSKAATEGDEAARQPSLAEASAHLYLAAQTAGSTPLLIGLDRNETRTAAALREAVSAADSIGLAGLRAQPAPEASLASEPDAAHGPSLQRMLEGEATLANFATILEDPQVLLSPKRIQIMRAIGVGLSDSRAEDSVAEVLDATDDTLQAVFIPPSSTIQLLTANADLPFAVRNDLPWPVSVALTVSPSDPRLDVQSVTPAVVQAGTTSRVKVPVSARVGSGELDLRLDLASPTGVPIGQPETVRVAVRAEWETIGLGILGGLIVLLIALGVVRTIRRRRREAAEEQAAAEALEAATAEADAVEADADDAPGAPGARRGAE